MKSRHIDQWNRTENSQLAPHKYAQVIFLYCAMNEFNGEGVAFSTNDARATGHPHEKKYQLQFHTYTKSNSKWITDLNVKHKLLNF